MRSFQLLLREHAAIGGGFSKVTDFLTSQNPGLAFFETLFSRRRRGAGLTSQDPRSRCHCFRPAASPVFPSATGVAIVAPPSLSIVSKTAA